MTQPTSVESIYRSAMDCTACFAPGSELHLPTIDVPQPRWVGPMYHSAEPRVLIVMLNPGQGDGPQLEQNLNLKELLHRYKSGSASFAAVLEFQSKHMQIWGRPQGKFLPFYTSNLGLKLDSLSFLNIALCATKENKYPRYMLSQCFARHTSAVTIALRPQVILLSGSATHAFQREFVRCLPDARVIPMMHYAHREGAEVEAAELTRVRNALIQAPGNGGA